MSTRRNHDRTFGLIDRSTGDDAPHRDRPYTLATMFPGEPRQTWNFVLPVPQGIDSQLKSGDWEEILTLFQTKIGRSDLSPFERLVLYLRINGAPPGELMHGINKMVARALYNKFVARQMREGNKAWIAPRSMTQTRGEPL